MGISIQSCPFSFPNRKGAAVNIDEKASNRIGVSFNRRNRRSGQLFYEVKALGYDLRCVARRVADIGEMELDEIFSKGRQDRNVRARSLLCFWAVRELGMSLTDSAREFEMSVAGVGYAVERGERITRDNQYRPIKYN